MRIRDDISFGPYPLTSLALPGSYSPVSIAFRVIGPRKPLHDKAVVLERGSYKFGSEFSDAIRGEELLDQLADNQLLKKDISVCSCSNIKGYCFTTLSPKMHQGILRLY
jgi:hypothetical protein